MSYFAKNRLLIKSIGGVMSKQTDPLSQNKKIIENSGGGAYVKES